MSKKRSQRNTKKYLKNLKAKRQKFSNGGYGGGEGALNEVVVYADRNNTYGGAGRYGANVDYGDGGYFSGMGTDSGGYNPYGATSGGGSSASSGASSGSGGNGDSDAYGSRNRSGIDPNAEPEPEKTPKELHDEMVKLGLAEGEYKGGEADATNDGTLEGDAEGGGGGGEGGGGDEAAPPPIKPIVEEEEEKTPTTGTNNTSSGTGGVGAGAVTLRCADASSQTAGQPRTHPEQGDREARRSPSPRQNGG
jgi:hypothetical protein